MQSYKMTACTAGPRFDSKDLEFRGGVLGTFTDEETQHCRYVVVEWAELEIFRRIQAVYFDTLR